MPNDMPNERSPPAAPPVAELTPYRGAEDGAEYRHRMLVNAITFVFVIALIGAALWLADTLALMRRNQDCVLSGRHGCTPVEYTRTRP